MGNDLEEHFKSIVKSCFVENAEFRVKTENGNICISINWYLNDPVRPYKRSKIIRVCIDEAAVEDYISNAGIRKNADKQLKKFIEKKREHFDPNHNNPSDADPPTETWIVTTKILNT